MLGYISKKYLIVPILLSIVFFSFSKTVSADNVFTFITDLQSIGVNEKSKEIKIHSENPVTETTYFTLVSTSNTGQFFSNSTTIDPVALGSYLYISSNSSNRSIYYKDTTAGDFIITVNIFNKEKTSQISTISQHILVGQQNTTEQNATTTTPTQTGNNLSNNSYLSSHFSFVEVSNYKPPETFYVTMGRNRLTTAGIKTEFEAKSNINASNVSYHWTFGDGSSAEGKRVEHVFDYAGEYVVVLNGRYFDEISVSRANIKVVEPKISIIEANTNFIKIKNNSNFEVNLYGWKIFYHNTAFAFPVDTIILPNASTEISSRITGFKPVDTGEVSLITDMVSTIKPTQKGLDLEPKNDISMIYEKAKLIQDEIALMQKAEQPKNINQTATPILAFKISTTTSVINEVNWLSKFKRFLFKRN